MQEMSTFLTFALNSVKPSVGLEKVTIESRHYGRYIIFICSRSTCKCQWAKGCHLEKKKN